jgi:xanthine dehydrogenase YagT iron-sulfur-binding subunit
MDDSNGIKITRRDFLITGATSVAATTLPSALAAQSAAGAPAVSKVSFQVNGQPRELTVDTRTTLLDALREHLKLTGTKKGCDQGQCGACTVIVNGRRVNSCVTLAVMQQGASITTKLQSTPPRERRACGACWRSAPRGASRIRKPRAAKLLARMPQIV